MPNPLERGPEHDPHEKKTCPDCDGKGTVKDSQGNAVTCPRCGGRGWILTRK